MSVARRFTKRPVHVLVVLVAVLSFCEPAPGQESPLVERWRWSVFTTDWGLPADRVYDLVETTDSVLWVATETGVAWYDGFVWQPVGLDQGLPERRPESIVPGHDDELLVVVDGALYRGGRAGFQRVPLTSLGGGGALRVRDVVPSDSEDGSLLILGERELFAFDERGLERLEAPAELGPAPPITRLWRTRAGSIWLNSLDGLFSRRQGEWMLRLDAPTGMFFRIEEVRENSSGTGIAVISDPVVRAGIWQWEATTAPRFNGAAGRVLARAVDVETTGRLLAGYDGGALRLFEDGAWTTLSRVPWEATGLNFFRFACNGDLWVGTDRGLYLNRAFDDLWTYWGHPVPDPLNRIHEIVEARDGTLWIGSAGGVEVIDPAGDRRLILEILGDSVIDVTAIAEDSDGNIWLGSGAGFQGAYRWDGAEWRHFGPDQGLTARGVHRIRRDQQGRLWFLGLGASVPQPQPGVFVYEDGTIRRWEESGRLISGRVYAFDDGPDGALWFGTLLGISRFQDGEWTHWTQDEGLRTNRVFALAVDSANRVWFGDQFNGLGKIEDGAVSYFTVADGLVDNGVWDVHVGPDDDVWIATQGGLSRFKDGTWARIRGDAGLGSARLWPVLPTSEHVFVGTLGAGVSVLNLGGIHGVVPRITIDAPVVEANRVRLSWNAYTHFATVPLSQIESRYRLGNDDWSPWSLSSELELNDLASGNQTFQVQAKGLLGDFDPSGATVSFEIPLLLYRRPVFFVPIALLSVVTSVVMGVSLRRRQQAVAALRESEKSLRLLHVTASEANEASEVAEVLRRVLTRVCAHMGWPVGHVYLPSEDKADFLEPTGIWHLDDEQRFEVFREVTERTPFAIGIGLPGRVLDSAQPAWIVDVTKDPNFPRAKLAKSIGVKAGFAFPVRIGTEVAAVMEFFSEEAAEPDEALLSIMADVGTQLGRIIERKRSSDQLGLERDQLEDAVDARTRELSESLSTIEESHKALKESEQTRIALSHMIVHDLNNPLTSLLAFSDFILGSDGLAEQVREDAQRINTGAKQMASLIAGLLDISKLEANEMPVSLSSVDAIQLGKDLLEQFSAQAERDNISLAFDPEVEELTLETDADLLARVLQNLVSNAFKYTPKGSHITLSLALDGNEAQFVVADDGPGIRGEYQERIFEKFFQIEAKEKAVRSGIGLGLAFCKMAVDALDGRIWLESEEDRGARFCVALRT